MACKHCGACEMDPGFMDRIEALRAAYGGAIRVSSGYRCRSHDRAVKGGGAHALGVAADLVVMGPEAWKLLCHAFTLGFRGVGVQQSGAMGKRFIHLDMAGDPYSRPYVWSYGERK